MSTTYAGSSAAFPTTMPLPSDGDARTASSVSTPMTALADRTAYLKAQTDVLHANTDLVRYLNWNSSPNLTIAGATMGVRPGNYAVPGFGSGSGNTQVFVAGTSGAAAVCYMSSDFGGTYSAELLSGVQAGETPTQVVCGANGVTVIATTSQYVFRVFEAVSTAPTVTKPSAFGSAISPTSVAIAFNYTQGKFVWMANNSTTSPVTRYSTDGTTWTAGGGPVGWSGYSGYQMAARPDTGVGMAVAWAGGSSFKTATSSDSGASWTVKTNFTSTNSLASVRLWVSFDYFTNTWFVTVGDTTSTDLWSSADDGATWTKIFNRNGVLGTPAIDDTGTVVMARSSSLFFSFNQIVYMPTGANTPRATGFGSAVTAGNSACYWTGNNFVALYSGTTSARILYSLRTGAFTGAVV